MSNWIQVAQEAIKIPGLLVEIYGDIAKPGVQQAGKALEPLLASGILFYGQFNGQMNAQEFIWRKTFKITAPD